MWKPKRVQFPGQASTAPQTSHKKHCECQLNSQGKVNNKKNESKT